jgi:pimeloyl-ACP methyl ester carboxylesterase
VALGLAGLGGWVGYSAAVGSEQLVASEERWPDCATPAFRYGWDYEAVNYDRADDAALEARYPDMKDCTDRGTPAGDEIVTSDGVPIAGWYIPAASGIDASGPTVVLVHGGKTNKSGMLEYAPPFHAAYNLVILDLRNSGRSGGHESTGGLFERQDLQAMIDWVVREKQTSWIAVVGNSNGAATALAEAVHDVRVQALVLDSMHATAETQLANVIETERGLPAWPGAPAIVAGVSWRIGQDLASVDPVRVMAELERRPVLLTHGTEDVIDRPEQSLERNLAAARAAGLDVSVETCEGAGHGEVVAVCGDAWAGWVLEFLAEAQGG